MNSYEKDDIDRMNYRDLLEAVTKFFDTRCTCSDELTPEQEADGGYTIPPCEQAFAEDGLRAVYRQIMGLPAEET